MFCAGWSLTVCYVHQVIFALLEDTIIFVHRSVKTDVQVLHVFYISPCTDLPCRTSNPPSTNIHVNYLNV